MYAALLTAIVTWISANFALPPDYDHPQLKLVPAMEITFLRYQAFTPAQRRDVLKSLADNTGDSHSREAVAVYDDRTRTIFLPDTWTGETPADLSVLVHEMVHHLQNRAHIKYERANSWRIPRRTTGSSCPVATLHPSSRSTPSRSR